MLLLLLTHKSGPCPSSARRSPRCPCCRASGCAVRELRSAAWGAGAARGSGGGPGAAAGVRGGPRTWRLGPRLRPSRPRNEPAHRTEVKVEDDVKTPEEENEQSKIKFPQFYYYFYFVEIYFKLASNAVHIQTFIHIYTHIYKCI